MRDDWPSRRITSYNVCYTKLLRADGLGDDLAEDEDENGEDHGEQGQIVVAQNLASGRARHRGPRRVGHGVQGQDGRDGPLHVLAQGEKYLARLALLAPQVLDTAPGYGIKRRFAERAEEGNESYNFV